MADDTNAQLAGEELVFLTLRDDPALQGILGGGDRVFTEWPDSNLTRSAFPRVTLLGWGTPLAGGLRARVTMQVAAWGWGGGTDFAKVAQIDVRVEALFKNKQYTHAGFRMQTEVGALPPPQGGGNRVVRMRQVVVMVAPA